MKSENKEGNKIVLSRERILLKEVEELTIDELEILCN
jgi:hypothetical protein